MPTRIDDTLYRSLFGDALNIVRTMSPQLAEHALQKELDPGKAVGDALDVVFRRLLESYEKLGAFTDEPNRRPADMRPPKPRIPFG